MKISFVKNISFKNLSYYLISSGFTALIGLVINPFLSIGLSHDDFAIIGYFASFASVLAPIMSFSLSSYYARNYFLIEEKERIKLLNTILSLFVVFGLLVLFFFYWGYYYYHINFVPSIPFKPYAFLSFFPIYFSSFYNIYLLDLRMQNKAQKYAVVTILNALGGALLSLLLVYVLRYGAEGRLIAMLIVAILFGIYSLKAQNFSFQIDWPIVQKTFVFCTPLAISAILTFFFMGIDRTFLAHLNDNHSLGLYNIGLQISGYLGIFGTVVLQTFEPDLYKYASLKQTKKVIRLIILITVVTLLPNLLFMLLSKPLINVLTYGKYMEAREFANILCLRNVTTSLSFALSSVLVGYGFSKYELFNKIIGSFFAILLYKYLINNYGFYGAAWGQSLSWLVMGVISMMFLFLRKNKIKTQL
ncbi:lipopolysaccharide biosynthesis protein [Flavobacterium tructae]|uniref:Polysaccharide biosynthesis protein n=1 Tax=Flavobacterium tructae TaxID=1114873 RepID=A0A1S1J522_9FLAO|nr:oligosaccharide flippase family protein [Flavobacterium tructae]OHT44644.1 hypothetical protein BHE19_13115 [Flavobacterium tructae]OXB19218.1 hypothetical protein B0A71_11755 [Flavobacterium tructae]